MRTGFVRILVLAWVGLVLAGPSDLYVLCIGSDHFEIERSHPSGDCLDTPSMVADCGGCTDILYGIDAPSNPSVTGVSRATDRNSLPSGFLVSDSPTDPFLYRAPSAFAAGAPTATSLRTTVLLI